MFARTIFLLLILSPNSWAKKATEEPKVIPVAEVGGSTLALGFASLAEYRDFITMAAVIIMFAFREMYQFKRDKERLAALEQQREADSKQIAEMAKSQERMINVFETFAKNYERDEERIDRRLSRLEMGGKQ